MFENLDYNYLLYLLIFLLLLFLNKINIKLSKNKELYNDIDKIKSKSFDLIDNNIMLQRNLDEIKNEIQIIKYKQFENTKDVKLLHDVSNHNL